MPYFNISVPANASSFFKFIEDLSNLKLVNLDMVYGWFGMNNNKDETNTSRLLNSTLN